MTRRPIRRVMGAELRLLWSWPAVWAVIGAWLVLSFLFAYVFPYLAYRTGSSAFTGAEAVARSVLELEMSPARAPDVAIQAMPLFGGAMMTVFGVLVTGSAYTWDCWKTAASHSVPRRTLMAGTVAAASCVAAALVVFVMGLCLCASLVIAQAEGLPSQVPDLPVWIGRSLVGFAVLEMWLLIGCALGVLFRGTGLPLGLALVWTLVVENLLRGVSPVLPGLHYLTDLLPGTATGSFVGAVMSSPVGELTPGVLSDLTAGRSAGTVLVYAAVCALVAGSVFARRDLA